MTVALVHAGPAKPNAPTFADLDKSLAQASKQGKLLFVQYGRTTCGNCQARRNYVSSGKRDLPTNQFVYADINCDDKKPAQSFGKHFKIEGNMLPFVIIVDSNGKQLAAKTGFGNPADYEALIQEAIKKGPTAPAFKKAMAEKTAVTKEVPKADK
jgi:thiol-disulfide isomerase/thioredoxin